MKPISWGDQLHCLDISLLIYDKLESTDLIGWHVWRRLGRQHGTDEHCRLDIRVSDRIDDRRAVVQQE